MTMNNLLSELGDYLGNQTLEFDSNGVCELEIEDESSVYLKKGKNEQSFYLYSLLGPIPEQDRLGFYEALLDKNLFGNETEEWSLACDMDRQWVLLTGAFKSPFLSADGLISGFESFVAQIEVQQNWILAWENSAFYNHYEAAMARQAAV